MKRWRALFCAVLLCGICLSGLSVPVSAADQPATMLYNGVELPNIDTVWTGDIKETYPYTFIYKLGNGTYNLLFSTSSVYVSGSYFKYKEDGTGKRYAHDSTLGIWSFLKDTTPISDANFTVASAMVWANNNILNSDGTIYFPASAPVDPNAPTTPSGNIELASSQVLDDSASFVLNLSDLTETGEVYSVKVSRFTGEILEGEFTSEPFSSSIGSLHLTAANLTPETEYRFVFSLLLNGEETGISTETTVTTLAGEGEVLPDYSGQLGDIQDSIGDVQQGIGDVKDSVDNVGTKLDGVQGTLTETKEEIIGLPQKIATSITEGVKGLFIPSQEDLTEIKDKYETMLAEKLGFVWQAFDLLTTFVGDLQTNLDSGEAYEFTFPGVKLPMQGEEFVLVAETPVSLENDLMDVLRPVLGTIVSAIAVIAFVNMAHDYVLAIVSGISAYEFERRRGG